MALPERKWERIFWTWAPRSTKEANEAIVKNFWLHWFPAKIYRKSLSFTYSFWLGTISAVLFVILAITGILLMFYYIPSVARAYGTMKDLEYVVSYGWLLRGLHRMAAHLMVGVVFLHMVRVFYTGAYKRSPLGGNRPVNWIVGVVLLLLTLALSYTGYLLPWDQLAFWAMTIGANVANSVPYIGKYVKYLLIGGTVIGQNTLLRFYVLHCVVLPVATVSLVAYHMWRIRKDGGLACVDQFAFEVKKEETAPSPTKTYTLLGITKGTEVSVITSSRMEEEERVETSPNLLRRFLWVSGITLAVTFALALVFKMPLEAPANPAIAPNPAKAPWYFLWLQELIADTTFTVFGVTVNGGFVGGVLIPAVLVVILALWPFIDKSSPRCNGRWFPRERWGQNVVFTLIVLTIIVFLLIGAICRGPNWQFFWPWEEWPELPVKF